MLSFSSIQDAVIHIGAPSTAVITVVMGLHLGWFTPFFDTDLSRTARGVMDNTRQLDLQSEEIRKAIEQHVLQMQASERQLDALLSAMREVCFNTAKSEVRQRACAELNHSHAAAPVAFVLE